jgi:hypothetical protein
LSQVLTTGFIKVINGQKTTIDLKNYSNVISSRIRWKGIKETHYYSNVSANSSSGTYSVITGTIIKPVPAGYTFIQVNITTTVTNNSGAVIPRLDASTYSNIATDSSGSNLPAGGTVQNSQTSFDAKSIGTYVSHSGCAMDSNGTIIPAAISVSGRSETLFSKTEQTSYIHTTVNNQTTEYIPSLENDQITDWIVFNGLFYGEVNTIIHNIGGIGAAYVEIEYTVEAKPVTKTLDPLNVSYSSAQLIGQITAFNGVLTAQGFEYGPTPAMGIVVNKPVIGVGQFTHNLTGLAFDTQYFYRSFGVNDEGTGYGVTKTFRTLYPTLPAPTRNNQDDGARTDQRRPWFELILTRNTNNPAAKYHARIRFAEYINMSTPVVYDSSIDSSNWELWNGSVWVSFPTVGVDPDSLVRVRPGADLPLATLYWDAASYDGTRYGTNTTARSIRILLAVNGLYALAINVIDWDAFNVSVVEAANGQVGEITVTLNNKDGAANSTINYGDTVILGVNDVLGNTDEFKGIVRSKSPSDGTLEVKAVTGSGILGERRVKVDYASQDVGLTVKVIIDTYCQPITSANINTSTGISAPIQAKDKTPLSVLDEIRKQYGFLYYIDKDWDAHFYLPTSIGASYITVMHGEVE